MTRTQITRVASIAALLAATVQTASAQQVAPGITIVFDVAGVVPVGNWGVAAAALFVGLVAAYFLRSRERAVSRMLAIGAVVIAGALSINSGRADAVIGNTSLISSPTSITISGVGTYPFVNAAGSPIILRTITLTNPGSNTINTLDTTCTASRVLSGGQTCVVVVVNNNDG